MNKLKIEEIGKEGGFDIFCKFMSGFNSALKEQICFTPGPDEWMKHTFDDPDFEKELFLGAFDGARLVGAVLGIIRKWKDPEKGFLKFISVESSPAQSEVTASLLSAIENRLFNREVSQIHFGSCSPLYLFPGLYDGDNDMHAALKVHGWSDVSERINRVIDLTNMRIPHTDLIKLLKRVDGILPEEGSATDRRNNKLSLLTASGSDKNELLSFVENEFSKSWAEEIKQIFSPDNQGFCSVLKNKNNKVIGFAAVHASNPNWFGPMGVEKSLRGHGLGKLLVIHSLLNAKKQIPAPDQMLLPWINDKDSFYCNILGDMKKYTYRKMVRVKP